MTGVDSSELILLLIIGLIVLGPKRLPEIASKIGGWIGQARRMTRMMKRQLEEELSLDTTPTIKPPVSNLGATASKAPDPADPAYDDEGVPDHIPSDDDTYSPIHDGEDDDADQDDAKREEKLA